MCNKNLSFDGFFVDFSTFCAVFSGSQQLYYIFSDMACIKNVSPRSCKYSDRFLKYVQNGNPFINFKMKGHRFFKIMVFFAIKFPGVTSSVIQLDMHNLYVHLQGYLPFLSQGNKSSFLKPQNINYVINQKDLFFIYVCRSYHFLGVGIYEYILPKSISTCIY